MGADTTNVSFQLALANLEYEHQALSATPTRDVTSVPRGDGLWFAAAHWTTLSGSSTPGVGTRAVAARYVGGVAVEAWIDVDGDGDLVEESPADLNEYTPTRGARSLFLRLGPAGDARTPTTPDALLARLVLDPIPPGESAPSYHLQRVYAPTGTIPLGGARRRAVLWDGNIDGRFTDGNGDGVFADLDGDGRLEVDPYSIEFGPFAVPFTFGDRRFRASPSGDDGATLTWIDLGPAPPRVAVQSGIPAPTVDLRYADGGTVRRADWSGQPTLLYFWASSCGTCAAQMPDLRDLHASAHRLGLEVLGVSFDEDRGAFDRFVAERGMSWPNVFEGRGYWENAVATAFQVRGAGAMVLIAPDGTIEGKYTHVPDVRRRVEAMLGPKPR